LNKTDKKRRTNRGGYTEIEKVNRGGYIKLTVAVTILGKYQKGLLLTLKTNTLRFGIKNHWMPGRNRPLDFCTQGSL